MGDTADFMNELDGGDPVEDDFGGEDYLGAIDAIEAAQGDPPPPIEEPGEVETPEPAPASTEPEAPVDTPPPAEAEPQDEAALLREQNALLLARLNDLQAQVNGTVVPAPTAPVPTTPVPATTPEQVAADIFGGQDFDEVLSDKAKFLGMMAEYGKVILRTAYDNIATTLPNVVTEQVNYNQKMKEISDEFYSVNADLVNVKPTVAAVMQKLIGENPSKPISEILQESAVKTRELLGLNKTIVKPPSTAVPPPAPSTGSKRMVSGTPQATTVSDEIAALAKLGF